jgi:putative ABC transport system permease protein
MVWEANSHRGFHRSIASPGNYLDWKAQNDVFTGMAGLRESRSVLIDGDRAEEFGKQSVTADFFPVLGVQPVRGRLFTTEEDRASVSTDTLLLISYRLWQSWFGGNENVIGRKVQVNAVPRTIIGVLPPGFYFLNREIDLWEPVGLNPSEDYRKTQGYWMTCVARMRPGVAISQAQAHMTALAARLATAYPAFNKNWTVELEPLRDAMLSDQSVGQDSRGVKTSLLVLLGAVGLMLAVACANVANLLLARYSSRRREIAVRASLGAGRGRVIRQLLTESLLLSLAGGLCGVVLARWGVSGLLALAPASLTHAVDIHFDSRILIFAIGLSMVTGILFGIAPALVTSRADLIGALRGDSRSGLGAGGHLRAWLVGAEVAISVVLLTGAILLFRSLVGFEALNPGLDPSNLLTFRVAIPAARYQKIPQRTQFFSSAIEQIEHLPGVRSASAVIFQPFSGPGFGTWVNVQGRPPAKPGEELFAIIRSIMPGYFRTLRIPIKQGRDFIDSDNVEKSPQRFIVNEAFVRQFLRGERPLGKKINTGARESLRRDRRRGGRCARMVDRSRTGADRLLHLFPTQLHEPDLHRARRAQPLELVRAHPEDHSSPRSRTTDCRSTNDGGHPGGELRAPAVQRLAAFGILDRCAGAGRDRHLWRPCLLSYSANARTRRKSGAGGRFRPHHHAGA